MLTIKIVNDETGTNEIGNYDYVVKVNFREIARGKVHGHNRVNGWQELIKIISEQEKQ